VGSFHVSLVQAKTQRVAANQKSQLQTDKASALEVDLAELKEEHVAMQPCYSRVVPTWLCGLQFCTRKLCLATSHSA
jgi:hypothetical protein